MIQRDRLVKTLQNLVRIPSHESMKEISEYVAREIRKLGLKPDVDEDGNVLASIGSGPSMVLNAHLDTVGVEGYPKAFSGEIKEDRLYGRGSCDDKSGVAAMLELMKVLKEDPPKKQVIFAFTVWEETGDKERDGAYRVVKDIKPSHGIVLESTTQEKGDMKIDIGCKGRFVYELEVIGKAVHSGRPMMGRNAIYLASQLTEKLRGFSTVSTEIPGVGKVQSYLSITQIEAKEGNNVIPGKCTLTADYRAVPGEKEPDIRQRIEKICREVLGDDYRITLLEEKNGFLQTGTDDLEMFRKWIGDSGVNVVTGFCDGWLDAAVFHDAGIVTFNCGPGTIGQAHKSPEYCWIPGLVKGTEAILNVIRGWDAL